MAKDPRVSADALLSEDVIALAASMFEVQFTGAKVGRQKSGGQMDKELRRRFGASRTMDDHYAFQAVIYQIILIWERAGAATRTSSGLLLLPGGVRLLNAEDPDRELRALLRSWPEDRVVTDRVPG